MIDKWLVTVQLCRSMSLVVGRHLRPFGLSPEYGLEIRVQFASLLHELFR
jgi:hypothetical protein